METLSASILGVSRSSAICCSAVPTPFSMPSICCGINRQSSDEEERRRFRNGEDLRYLPLIDRKLRLRVVMPKRPVRLLYCDYVDSEGEGLFRLACGHDLEGIVAKRKSDP
jgi:hypothetical protein